MRSEELADALELLADGPPWDTAWLRSLLPELAVRGRLVAQEAGDEDALTLIRAADRDRAARVAQGELRKERRTFLEGAPPIEAAERHGWLSAGLGSFAHIEMGQSPKSDTYNTQEIGLPFFQGKAEFGEDHPSAVQWCSDPKKVAEVGDVLVSVRAPVGPTNLANERCCVGRGLAAIRALAGMPPRFLRLLVQAGEPQLVAAATGTTFVAIGRDDLFNLVCGLPPLAEQHRIVAKVDELMEHAAVVEERHLAATSARVRLRDAALHALAEAEDHEAVETAWSRIEEHFDDLFTEPEDIQPLRQTIQDLFADSLLRWNAGLPNRPPLGDSLVGIEAGKSPSCLNRPRVGTEWGVLKVSACSAGVFRGEENKAAPPNFDINPDHEVVDGDLLLARASGNIDLVGRAVLVKEPEPNLALCDKTLRLKTDEHLAKAFLHLFLSTSTARTFLTGAAAGAGGLMRNISQKRIRELPIPLPPLAEQHRIVAKVDELMALCGTLETSLTRAKATREQFAGSISHALAQTQ